MNFESALAVLLFLQLFRSTDRQSLKYFVAPLDDSHLTVHL